MSKYASKEQLTALVADMASKINIASGTEGVSGSYTPVGTIIAYMGTTAPADHLACDGSLHQIASYPQLADFFYEQFGASNYFGGNGTSTFAVPDLRGEFLRGTGTNSHTNQGSGASVGDHQDGTVHSNSMYDGTNICILSNSVSNQDKNMSGVARGIAGRSTTDNYGSKYTSRPTNTSILWCIKAIDYKVPEDRKQDYYSYSEIPVAKWVDGTTIFQKTISYTGDIAANDENNIANLSTLGIDKVIKIDGILNSSTWGSCSLGDRRTTIRVGADKVLQVLTDQFALPNVQIFITIQYTKTA